VLIAVGLNQKCATVSDRERLAVPAEEMAQVVQGYAALDGVDEIVLLSTCYRVEMYAASSCPAAAAIALRQALVERARSEALPLFELHGADALRHALRVASSLESAVLGEPQILGQVKEAHRRALDAGVIGKELNGVLNRVYEVAKRVRSETAVGRSGVSWGHAATALAEKVLGSVSGRRVLVVGAGEMARLSAQHLREQGGAVTVVNRTLENAEALAREVGGTARPLDALGEELLLADVVVSAAPVAPAAFAPAALAAAMKARRRRDLVLVDLAVPRAIPGEVAKLDGVWLCDVDDLTRLTERAMSERSQAVVQAERIIEEEIQRFNRELAERRAAPIIQAMRAQATEIARGEVDRTLKRLAPEDRELETRLDALANAIVSKLLHHPSTRLRKAGTAPGGERLMAAAVEIFGLPADEPPPAAP
jgi:glutamyl-tRNA reductase